MELRPICRRAGSAASAAFFLLIAGQRQGDGSPAQWNRPGWWFARGKARAGCETERTIVTAATRTLGSVRVLERRKAQVLREARDIDVGRWSKAKTGDAARNQLYHLQTLGTRRKCASIDVLDLFVVCVDARHETYPGPARSRIRQGLRSEEARAAKAPCTCNHHVVADISGATGLRIIRAILEGERDPAALARLRDTRCHASVDRRRSPGFTVPSTYSRSRRRSLFMMRTRRRHRHVTPELRSS